MGHGVGQPQEAVHLSLNLARILPVGPGQGLKGRGALLGGRKVGRVHSPVVGLGFGHPGVETVGGKGDGGGEMGRWWAT